MIWLFENHALWYPIIWFSKMPPGFGHEALVLMMVFSGLKNIQFLKGEPDSSTNNGNSMRFDKNS